MKLGRVERELRKKVEAGEKLVFTLVDPERGVDAKVFSRVYDLGVDAVLVGGSLNVAPYDVDRVIEELKDAGVEGPFIIFPGGLNNIAAKADAILFMILMNSLDPYWLIEAQVTAAPIIRRLGLEPIPSAYIIYGYGGAAGHIGRALPIPYDRPYLVAAYAMAAEMLGLRLIYIEAGSGSPSPVPSEAIRYARASIEYPLLVVGGGIREAEKAREVLEAGADAIVIGTILEKNPEKAMEIIAAVKKR